MKKIILFQLLLCISFSIKAQPYYHIDTIEYHSPYNTLALLKAELMDINSDGFKDVIALQSNGSTWDPTPVYAFINDSTGHFIDSTNSVFNNGLAYTIASTIQVVADYNGDGREDVYCADLGRDAPPHGGNLNSLIIQDNNGHLEKQSIQRLPNNSSFTHRATTADIDGDGDLDIYDANVWGGGTTYTQPSLLINNGSGYFTDDISRLPADVTNMYFHRYTACLFEDVNKDGYPDLILGNHGQSTPDASLKDLILLNDGNGHFQHAPANSMPPRSGWEHWTALDIFSGDFNGDGWPDLIMSYGSSANTEFKTVLLINNKDGTFYFPPNAVLDTADQCGIAVVDINNDGWLDIILSAGAVGGASRFYLNDGNAVFTDKTTELGLAGNHYSPLRAADLDNDGRVDFFALSQSNIWYYEAKNLQNYDMGIAHFQISGTPQTISPNSMQIVSRSPLFKWNPASKASTVQIQVALDINFTNLVYDKTEITADSAFRIDFANENTYYWRVRGKNTAGFGIWSDTAAFITQNQAPFDIMLSDTTLSKDAGIASIVGIFTTADPDKKDSHIYSFAIGNGVNDADNTKFTIVGDTLKTNTYFNTNSQQQYFINIKSQDLSGMSIIKAFIITIELNGLVAFYPFNGNAEDESGNGHNGTPTGVILTNDKFGNANSAYYFDGSNSYIETSSQIGFAQSPTGFTISAWVNSAEMQSGWIPYAIMAENGNFNLVFSENRICFIYYSGGIDYACYSADTVNTNQWYFIVLTYDSTEIKLYKNGKLNGIYNTQGPIDNNTSNLTIGSIWSNTGVFKGKLDEVSIYNKPLRPDEIQNLYTNSPAKGGVVSNDTTLCPGNNTGTLTLSGYVGNIIEWQKKHNNESWVSIPSTSLTYSEMPDSIGTFYYRAVTQYGTGNLKYSKPAIVNVLPFVEPIGPEELFAFYPFHGNANDESLNNYDGTPTDVTLTTDQYGNANSAYYFNGIDSKIEIGNQLGLVQSPGGFTITAWVYPEQLQNDWTPYTIIAESDAGANFTFVLTMKRICFRYYSGGIDYGCLSADTLLTNQWYFIAVTFDSTEVKLYKDGMLNAQFTTQGPIDNNPANLIIGLIYGTTGVFKGKLDEIAIYNKPLSSVDMQNLYLSSPAKGGTVSGDTTLCPGNNTGTLALSGNVGNVIEWQKSSDNINWVSIPTTSQTYSEIPDSAGTLYYRAVTQYGACFINYSNPATVIVSPLNIGVSVTDNIITAYAATATYQWLDCDNSFAPISGETNQSYTATADGNYAVLITQGSCSDTSVCIPIIIVGVDESNNTGIEIYPNPTNGKVYISSPNPAEIKVYNMIGEIICEINTSQKNYVSLRSKGVYIFEITSKENKTYSKVVVQ